MKAEVITIGDEVLRGEIVDSNKARLAERLLDLDIECHYQSSVRDHRQDIADALRLAVSRCDFVIVSGGLGPTRDDITTEVLAETFGRSLQLHGPSLDAIEGFFRRLGREMTETNRKQAFFPEGADVLENPVGTAPGFMVEVAEHEAPIVASAGGGPLVFCLPGVPRELTQMMDEQVLPRIGRRLGAGASGEAVESGGVGIQRTGITVVRARLLRTFGIGESSLESELAHIARDGDVELGFRTTFPDNFLRVVARAGSAEQADERIARVVDDLYKCLGDLIYGEQAESLPRVGGRLLAERGRTLATAESCTGGLIAELVTEVPGSSAYFLGGVVAYANSAKASLLGVPEALLIEHGAVSEPVVRAMAEGVRERFGADLAVATTGISGPDGGTAEKPVGLVYVGLATAEGTHADGFVFPVERTRHRRLTAQVGLDWVRRSLLGVELTGPSLLRQQGGGPSPGAPRA